MPRDYLEVAAVHPPRAVYTDTSGCQDWRWWRAGGSGCLTWGLVQERERPTPVEVIDRRAITMELD